MDRVEQLVRDSLRARAEDVEPTPHLYRGVQERIARRRRRTLAAWVPAGAVALGVAIAVPFVLDTGTQVPSIEDYAEQQLTAGPASPTHAVLVDRDEYLSLLDLRDGTVSEPYGGSPLGTNELPMVDVAPVERTPVPRVHTAAVGVGSDGLEVTIHAAGGAETDGLDPLPEAGGGFAVSPDGGWAATLASPGPGGDADGWALQLRPTPVASEGFAGIVEPGIVVPAGSVVQDWSGSVAPGGASEVTVITPEGRLIGFPLVAGDASFTWEDETVAVLSDTEEVVAYADAHLGDDTGFTLVWRAGEGQLVLEALDEGGDILVERSVTDLVGDPDAGTLSLDAWGDSAVLSSSEGTSWLLRTAGDGALYEPIALPDGTVAAALVGRELSSDRDDPAAGGVDDSFETAEPGEDLDDVTVEEPTLSLAGPIVQADARSVVLRTEADEQILLDLPVEGESTVLEVAVRPGSTPEDLTAVVVTSAEGFTDLRWIEVVDGQVQDPVVLEGTYASGGVSDASVRVEGLAWTPDGQKLLWVDRADAGEVTLRSIGWDDGPGTGDTATDNASFGLPDAFMAGLADVVDAGGGRVVARFVSPDDDGGWYRWVLQLQADGALAAPTAEPELVTSPVGEGGVTALAGADDESRPTWLLVFGSEGPRLVADPFGTPREVAVPPAVAPGEGLPETWLHVLDDGVLVGGSGMAWVVADDRAGALGQAVDVDPVR
jgi:hypothetical protein